MHIDVDGVTSLRTHNADWGLLQYEHAPVVLAFPAPGLCRNPAESEAHDLLRDQRLGRNLRLEQELIPQHLVEKELRLRASSSDW